MDGCEILHQLIAGKHPTTYRVSTILLVVQDFFHPQYVMGFDQSKLVGGIPTPLKNTKVNWDDYSQYMKNKKCFKPPTRKLDVDHVGEYNVMLKPILTNLFQVFINQNMLI